MDWFGDIDDVEMERTIEFHGEVNWVNSWWYGFDFFYKNEEEKFNENVERDEIDDFSMKPREKDIAIWMRILDFFKNWKLLKNAFYINLKVFKS